jgi:hypothetical protein
VFQALLYLLHQLLGEGLSDDVKNGGVIICVDSLYAINMVEGHWEPKQNKDLISRARSALSRLRGKREVTFVHVRGHSGDPGNDRADDLVQWGKTDGPYSRYQDDGTGEGDGRWIPLRGHLRMVKLPGEEVRNDLVLGTSQATESEIDEEQEDSGSDSSLRDALEQLANLDAEEEHGGLPLDSGWRDGESGDDSTGSVLRMLLESMRSGEETDADEEESRQLEPDEDVDVLSATFESIQLGVVTSQSSGEGRQSMVLRPNR